MNIHDFDRKKNYWDAFWQGEVIDRPLVCITAPKEGAVPHYHHQNDNISAAACLSGDYDPFIESFRRANDSLYHGGESIPFINLTLGPDQYAAFLGADIISQEGYETTWVHSIVDDWAEFEVKLRNDTNSYFSKIKLFIARAAELSDDTYLVSMLDLHGNLDALSALRGPQNLCMDLIDCPDEVLRVLGEVRKTFTAIYNEIYTAAKMDHTGSIGWAPTYLPSGKFAVLQCDFSVMISAEHGREFFIPAIAEEASYVDRCVYHLDGKGCLTHLDDILAIDDIDVIQWVPGDGNPRSIEWMPLLQKIQQAGKGLWLYDWSLDEILACSKELKPEKLVFSAWADSENDSEKFLNNLKSRY